MRCSRNELARALPLFADLDEVELRRLSRQVRTRYVNAGQVIVRKDTSSRSVYFVASGAVEQEVAGQTTRLGRGEMFGQMGVLTRRVRRAEVRAITPTTLLILDEDGFRRVLKRSAGLRRAVRDSIAAGSAEQLRLPELMIDAPEPAQPETPPTEPPAPDHPAPKAATPAGARRSAAGGGARTRRREPG